VGPVGTDTNMSGWTEHAAGSWFWLTAKILTDSAASTGVTLGFSSFDHETAA